MKIQPKDKRVLLGAVLGEIESDLAIKDVQLVNVTTEGTYPVSVHVYDDFISHVEYKELGWEEQFAREVVNGQGKYLIPGPADAHEHIEGSTTTPRNFARAVIPKGTTAVITDPHEIGNAWGIEKVRYIHEASEGPPMRQLVGISSCMSAVSGLERTGAKFGPTQIEGLVKLERVVGLAEATDYLDVIHGGDRMMDIIRTAEEYSLYLRGHTPPAEGRMLPAYLCDGPSTRYESKTTEEALEEMRSGMRADARDSSITKNMEAIWNGVKDFRLLDDFCLCTDDRETDDIPHNGYINDVVGAVIRYGVEPVTAIRSATLNSAREAGLQNLGAVAPRYAANMLLVDDLREPAPSHVFYAGKLTAQEDRLLVKIEDKSYPLESANSVHVRKLATEDFIIHPPVSQGKVKVSLVKYYDANLSAMDIVCEKVWMKDGGVDIDGDQGLKLVAAVNRYEGNDNIVLGLVRGFGTKTGALVSTVSHDSHGLTIAYGDPEEALMAAEELARTGGGICAVKEEKILYTLVLPLVGLMSLKPVEELAEDSTVMKGANRALGLTSMENSLLRIVTLALSVIPDAEMPDTGLVQVTAEQVVPLFPE